jgi:hypothetical protein
MNLTRGGSVQRPLTSGPMGWPVGQTPWPAGPTLQPHGSASWEHSPRGGNRESKVKSQWSPDPVATRTRG